MQKKPTTNASSESRSKPSELRFKLIQTHRSPYADPNPSHRPTVIKTHDLHYCQNPHLQRNPPPMPCRNHYRSHWSSDSNPLEPSKPSRRPIWFHRWGSHRVLGLKRVESKWEREKEEREKKRNNEKGERNFRVKKGKESVLKNYYYFIQFNYSTI